MSDDTIDSIYRCNTRTAGEYIHDCFEAGLVPNLESAPGSSKSSIFHQAGKKYNLKVIDFRLTTATPEDLNGLPWFDNGKARFMPFDDLFPLADAKVPDDYDGWLLFLDEMNSAQQALIAASYKLILDRYVGQFPLHERVMIGVAGNRMGDRAIVNPTGTAMQSRLINLEMDVVAKHWLEDFAIPNDFDERIVAYISENPDKLMDFDPEMASREKNFCCPRTWEFMNKLIDGKQFDLSQNGHGTTVYTMDKKLPLYAGTITSGVAVDFVKFTQVFHNLLTINMIIADPVNCPVPMDNSSKWALTARMAKNVDRTNFEALAKYGSKFDLAYRLLFMLMALKKDPTLRQHPVFPTYMQDVFKYLEGQV